MLDECPVGEAESSLYKLAAAFESPIESVLLGRGISPASLGETIADIGRAGGRFTAQEIVSGSFRKRLNRTKPFPETRFSDGTAGVYYSAAEVATCKREIAFHLKIEEGDPPRFYSLIGCRFSGVAADLRGKEKDYPDLVSQTSEGYPFCQRLGAAARRRHIDAFHTPSARKKGGTCVPVFTESALLRPFVRSQFRVTASHNRVHFEAMRPNQANRL